MDQPADDAASGSPPSSAAASAAAVVRLMGVMARLRAEDGCPWDLKQTWRSLTRHVLEEAHELVDAVDRGDPDAVREECGDLLLEVVFMAQIAAEEGRFGMAEIARGIADKLIRRHPHVFGGGERAKDAAAALASWEAVKAEERAERSSPADGLPRGLPALLFAVKVIEGRVGRQGGDADEGAPRPGGLSSAAARLEAARRSGDRGGLERTFGDFLFAAAAEAHRLGLDPEAALRQAARRSAAREAYRAGPALPTEGG